MIVGGLINTVAGNPDKQRDTIYSLSSYTKALKFFYKIEAFFMFYILLGGVIVGVLIDILAGNPDKYRDKIHSLPSYTKALILLQNQGFFYVLYFAWSVIEVD